MYSSNNVQKGIFFNLFLIILKYYCVEKSVDKNIIVKKILKKRWISCYTWTVVELSKVVFNGIPSLLITITPLTFLLLWANILSLIKWQFKGTVDIILSGSLIFLLLFWGWWYYICYNYRMFKPPPSVSLAPIVLISQI